MTQIGQMLIDEGIEKGIEKGIERGIEKGKAKGETLKIISLIRKKLQKGYTIEQTADALEEDMSGILPFFTAIENDPAATDDMIFDKICENRRGL